MLVNASWSKAVQFKLRNRIADVIDGIRNAVTVDAGKGQAALQNSEILSLHEVWESEFSSLADGIAWPSVQAKLYEVLAAARVVEVNSNKSAGTLNYDDRGEFG